MEGYDICMSHMDERSKHTNHAHIECTCINCNRACNGYNRTSIVVILKRARVHP